MVMTPQSRDSGITLARDSDAAFGASAPADEITIRRNFRTQSSQKKRDNFLLSESRCSEQGRPAATQNAGLFVALGSAAQCIGNDYRTTRRVVWCITGKARDRKLSDFKLAERVSRLSVRIRRRQVFHENFAGAENGPQ